MNRQKDDWAANDYSHMGRWDYTYTHFDLCNLKHSIYGNTELRHAKNAISRGHTITICVDIHGSEFEISTIEKLEDLLT